MMGLLSSDVRADASPGEVLSLAPQFARHASPLATIIYTHPPEERLAAEQGFNVLEVSANKTQSFLTSL
jgi:hypothetical protein